MSDDLRQRRAEVLSEWERVNDEATSILANHSEPGNQGDAEAESINTLEPGELDARTLTAFELHVVQRLAHIEAQLQAQADRLSHIEVVWRKEIDWRDRLEALVRHELRQTLEGMAKGEAVYRIDEMRERLREKPASQPPSIPEA